MEENEIINSAISSKPLPNGNRSFYEKISFWIGIAGSVLTICLTAWNANTKMHIDEREAELKSLELKLKERSAGVEESKERVERYKWVISLFPNLNGSDNKEKNFTINLIRLALTEDEAKQLFTGLQASSDTTMQSLGQKGNNAIDNEPIFILVSQMNAGTADVRKHAVAQLQKDYKSSPQAITLALRLYDEDKIKKLSASGVINGLSYLSSTDPEGWNKEQILAGKSTAKRIHASNPGPQTLKFLAAFESMLEKTDDKK
ncbi:MAG: hypothetical protein NT040_18670 [Bacteroidetes bacterium]|nr:hypothetical protein [Bacteroidota bacterium]